MCNPKSTLHYVHTLMCVYGAIDKAQNAVLLGIVDHVGYSVQLDLILVQEYHSRGCCVDGWNYSPTAFRLYESAGRR